MISKIEKCKVLLVEDEALIAMYIEDMLTNLGHEVIETIGRIEKALVVAREKVFDLALLDVNVDGAPVYPVADILIERGIPFLFATGYGSGGLDVSYANVPRLPKPFALAELQSAIHRILADRRALG